MFTTILAAMDRRTFLETVPAVAGAALSASRRPASAKAPPRTFLDIMRSPDAAIAETSNGEQRLTSTSRDRWEGGGIVVTTTAIAGPLRVELAATAVGVRRLHLRWNGTIDRVRLLLGDAWERAYGDLEWRAFVPDRALPWYVAMWDGDLTHAYGVRTGAAAFCFWQADPHGLSFWADVRSGGVPVQLRERTLIVCDVVSRPGRPGESAFAAVHAFCKTMCPDPRRPDMPVYGSNDWYWAYGSNSAASVQTDAQHIVELSPTGGNRPFCVIDDGWQPDRGQQGKAGVGLWDHGNEKFGDMARVAENIRGAGARAGIWVRPLLAPAAAPDNWRLSRDRNVLDPTVADVRHKVVDDIRRLHDWGYELIKHDYSTFDLFGRWGFQMGTALTRDGWAFAEGASRTTAEVIRDLYAAIRDAAGESSIIGCNTVSHLSAGVFDICRIGDDTSGREWNRVPKMGVNALAFRGVQHGAFYTADADCVGVTASIPWTLNRQWLDLLARSGTMLFVSLAPDALGRDQRRDLRAALALAATPHPLGEPLDWQHTAWPSRWRLERHDVRYEWVGADGVSPG